MKKVSILLISFVIMISVVACSGQSVEGDSKQNVEADIYTVQSETESDFETSDLSAQSVDELNDIVSGDVEQSVAAMYSEYEQLKSEIDTYDKYLKNTEKMEEFYNSIYGQTQEMCIRMREYSLSYARLILAMDAPRDEKYDEMEELYDTVYDDAGEVIYDEIYDGILDEMYDVFYDGILDDAYDNAVYDEWSDARSDEYEWWSDTRSDVYEEWSDCRSEVYDFWSDIRSAVWDGDDGEAEEDMQEFWEDINDLKEH